tara:strand:+ start:21009 stop:21521 length:513 start_codon:yes stop_codon:yes gene_type:complete
MESIYVNSARAYVLPYLTRKYGKEASQKYLNTKSVPSDDMTYITAYVLPKPPKTVQELDMENEHTCIHAKRYMIRMYGDKIGVEKYKNRDFTIHDKKMIHTMNMLNQSYNKSCLERKCIASSEFIDCCDEQSISSPSAENVICKAFKMNGEKCTAKAKQNGLCMRHSKKV